MTYNIAKRLVSIDCGALSADNLYKHKALLTDAFYSSRGDYGQVQLFKDGYVVPIASESASGFIPKDKFLFQSICFQLDQCDSLLNKGDIKDGRNYQKQISSCKN